MNIKKIVGMLMVIFALCIGANPSVYAQKSEKPQKIAKRLKTKEAKYAAAMEYYQRGSYLTAAQLFEEIYPLYLSAPEGDTIAYLFADSYFKNNDYLMAAFHFNDYIRRYPQSPKVEDASFYAAKCYYLNSPTYNLDQSDSKMAIEGLQMFISSYPQSKYVEESNQMIDDLRNKLAHKDFSIGCMYYNTERYQAAQVCLQNMIKEYPNSAYTEEAMFYLVKNSYGYAQNSVESKKVERYQMVIDNANKLRAYNEQSKFLEEADKLAADAKKKRDKILNH
ncbi:MAG: outer membrane protein assembly factor BamD [Bacteroidales bacterium]|jgi:outer membrane protein assembly factor BamD|nr:outer membrane protein assembly factor BamD [Bacteroidales bacterium]